MPATSFSNSVIIRDCLHAECNALSHSPAAIERHLRLHGSAKSARRNHDNLVFKPLKLCVKHGGQLASLPSSRHPSASPSGSARLAVPKSMPDALPSSLGSKRANSSRNQPQSILNAHDVMRLQHSQFLTSRRPMAPSQRPNALLFNSFAALSHANPALCLAHVLPPPKREPLPPQGKLHSTQTDPDPDSVEDILGETMPIHRYLRIRRKHKRRVPGDDDGAAATRRLVSKLKKSAGLASKLPTNPLGMLKAEPLLTLNLDLEMFVPESLGTVNFNKNKSNINPNLRPSSTKSRLGSSRSGTATSRGSMQSAGSKDETSSRASDAVDDWEGNEQLMLDEEEDLGNINAPMLLNRANTATSSKPVTAGSTGGGVAAVLDMFPGGDDGADNQPGSAGGAGGPRAASGAPGTAGSGTSAQQDGVAPAGPAVIDRTAMALSFLTSAPGRTTADPRVLTVLDSDRESTVAGLLDLQAAHAEEMATTEADDEMLFTFMNDMLVLLMMQRVRATGAISVQYDAQIHDVLLDPLASSIRMTWTTCEYLRVIHSPPLFPSAVFSQLVSIVNDTTLDDRAKRKRGRLLCRRHLRKQSPTSALLFRSILGHLSRILVLAEALPRRDPHRKWLQYRLAIGVIPAVVQEGWTEDLPAHMRVVHMPTVTTARRGRRRTRSGGSPARGASPSPTAKGGKRGNETLGPGTAFWRDHLRRDLRLLPQPGPDEFAHAVLEGFPVPERSILRLNDVDDNGDASESSGAAGDTSDVPRPVGSAQAARRTSTAPAAAAAADVSGDSTVLLARAPSPPVGTPLALHSRPVSAAIIDARVAKHRRRMYSPTSTPSPSTSPPPPALPTTSHSATAQRATSGGLARHLRQRPHTASPLGTHGTASAGPRAGSADQRVKWAPPTRAPLPTPLKPRPARALSPLRKPISPLSPPPTAAAADTQMDAADDDDDELTSQRLLFDQLTLPVDTVDLAARALAWFFANADIVLDTALVRAVRMDRELKQEAAAAAAAAVQSSAPVTGSHEAVGARGDAAGAAATSAPTGRVLGMGRRGSAVPGKGAAAEVVPGSAPAARRIQSGKVVAGGEDAGTSKGSIGNRRGGGTAR